MMKVEIRKVAIAAGLVACGLAVAGGNGVSQDLAGRRRSW